MTRLHRWWPRGLIVRLVGLSVLLLLIVQLAGFGVVRTSIDHNARAQIAKELDTDEKVWRRLLEQNAMRQRQGAALLASDYGFRSAVSSGDEDTIRSALDNHGQRIGAAVTALLDTRLSVRSISSEGMVGLEALLPEMLPSLSRSGSTGQVVVVDKLPYQFVMVPILAPVKVGWVLMGFPLGQALADEMRQLLSVHVALRVRGADGQVAVAVSTLPAGLADALRRRPGEVNELAGDGESWLARSSVLGQVGGLSEALLLRSVDQVVAPYRQLQVLLAAISAGGVLLFAVGSALMARRVTTPLRSLVLGTQRLSRGEYDVPVAHTRRRDEIGNLARSFDRMRQDIAQQQAEIWRLAHRDRLTGLPNWERFREAVLEAISAAGSPPRPLAVITLDLDRFKHVNDVLGYAFGDRLLQAVTERLNRVVTSPDEMLARLGGNEFAVLLRGGDAPAALGLARRIAQALEEPLALDDQTVDLSAGIGLACWPDHAADVDTLFSRSEIAMFAAKRKQDGPMVYDPSFDSSSTQTLSLLTELRRAVEQGELRLYLQPKVSLADPARRAAEALLRWQHPRRGQVSPAEFIPFAEQTGFVRRLTLWVFEESARLLADARTAGLGLRLSVNLSHATCWTPIWASGWAPCWPATGCRPHLFVWKLPKAPSWTTRTARRLCCIGCPSKAFLCRLTTLAPGTRRWAISSGCLWTN